MHWGRSKRIRLHKFGANVIAYPAELAEDMRK
jgi:hypothetical protein